MMTHLCSLSQGAAQQQLREPARPWEAHPPVQNLQVATLSLIADICITHNKLSVNFLYTVIIISPDYSNRDVAVGLFVF